MCMIQTYSGMLFDLEDPYPDNICTEDIAHALSLTCRFAGHTRQFYSVAQHSLLVSRLVPSYYKLSALLHDAAEAYLVDIPTPLKSLLSGYSNLEKYILRAIREKYNLPEDMDYEEKNIIKHADMVAIAVEKRDLMKSSGVCDRVLWNHVLPTADNRIKDITIAPMSCWDSEVCFEMTLVRLQEEHNNE